MEFYITYILLFILKVEAGDNDNIMSYFGSDTFNTIQKYWQTEKKSFENALVPVLQQGYGLGGMNILVRNNPDAFTISNGFHFSDNVVDLVLLKTNLKELPIMIAPEVTFALASNYLHVEAGLGRMILLTEYILIRNKSEIVYTASEQNAHKKSPFSFQQVQDSGKLTIIAQDCRLIGYTITTFSGNTVNLGLDAFQVTNCRFSVEIYSSGLGTPPVFGPYFSETQSKLLQTMLSKPIRIELMPKLQAAVFAYVNTSAIFGEKLPQLRSRQSSIFKESHNYMSRIVGSFVQNIVKKNQCILELEPLQLSWNKTCAAGTCGSYCMLKDMNLYGLDTAYSAHVGGPFKVKSARVCETIRFSVLQVRGKFYFENTTVTGERDFAVELKDAAVNIEMEAKSSSFKLSLTKMEFTGWRSIEFSMLDMNYLDYERQSSQSIITGYLVNKIPRLLLDQMSQFFGEVNSANEENIETENSDGPGEKELEPENNGSEAGESKAEIGSSDNGSDNDAITNSVEGGTESDIHDLYEPSENEIKSV